MPHNTHLAMEALGSKKIILQEEGNLQENFLHIRNTPGLCIAKDIDSKYSVISNDYAILLGWKNSEQCINLSDYDIPCAAVEAANLFIELDQKVVNNKASLISLYICKYMNGWKTLLSHKIPIQKTNGDITGIYGQVMDISSTNLYNWCLPLNQNDLKYSESSNKPRIYILSQEHTPLPLTLRQQACIFLLVRGKSMKEIANILDISVKTVEGHFEKIKLKMGCSSKSQLIEKAIDSGFLNYIPNDIFKKQWI